MSYLDTTIEEMKTQTGLLEFYKAIYEKLPEGRLTTKVVNGRLFYYRVDKDTQKTTYIPIHKKRLIFQLKQKRWLEESIKIMENNLKVQEKVLKQYKDYRAHSVEERLSRSYQGGTLDQYEKEYLIDLRDWAEDSYRKNPYHKENLRYETSFGLRVRSKSELIIAELLHKYGIPFRYDAKIRVKGKGGYWKTYYVDFLIMTPSGDEILWEHFGMMGTNEYREGAFERITDYFYHGYYVPKNLILTMDGPNGELDIAAIQRVVEGQLVPLYKGSGGLRV